MEYVDGECQYNLYGNGCNGIDGDICGGPCTVGEDFIEWVDNSGLAATNPGLAKQTWIKDADSPPAPYKAEGRKYSFSADVDLGDGELIPSTFWLWQEYDGNGGGVTLIEFEDTQGFAPNLYYRAWN